MTIQECYASIGGDFEGVMSRLMKPASVAKFTLMFPMDDSFSSLKKAYEAGEIRPAFLAAHSLKGMAVNLGFTDLYRAASIVTEEYRDGEVSDRIDEEMKQCEAEYEKVIQAIAAYAADRTDA